MNKATLITFGTEKLADTLLALRKGGPQVNLELDVAFASLEKRLDKLVDLLRREVAKLKTMNIFFVNYAQTRLVAANMDHLRRYIAQDLCAMSTAEAVKLMLEFISTRKNVMMNVEDREYHVESTFEEAYNDLHAMCKDIKVPLESLISLEALIEAISESCIHDPDDFYDETLANFKDIVKDEGLDAIKGKIMQSLDDEPYTVKSRLAKLKLIADLKEDVDAYIQACSFEQEPNRYDCVNIAERFVKHQRIQEAWAWLEKVDKSDRDTSNYQKVYARALIAMGEYKKVQEECLAFFDDRLCTDLYKEVFSAIPSEDQASFREQTIQKAFKERSIPQFSLEFLFNIQAYHEAAKFVRTYIDDLPAYGVWAFSFIASTLRDIDPLAASLLYRQMITYALEKAKSEDHEDAVEGHEDVIKYLVICAILNRTINDWEAFTSHDVYVATLKEAHQSKKQFWSAYELAMEQTANKKLWEIVIQYGVQLDDSESEEPADNN